MKNKISILPIIFLFALMLNSCKHEPEALPVNPSDNLAIDSIRATKKLIPIWEEIFITVYTRGKNLTYNWSANHGSMSSADSVTIKYWACPTCVGLNTVECKVSNEYGTVSDTIMIRVTY
ncbi:MAG: hypothetical protein V2A54_09500 [Bacteroidota bacterium]